MEFKKGDKVEVIGSCKNGGCRNKVCLFLNKIGTVEGEDLEGQYKFISVSKFEGTEDWCNGFYRRNLKKVEVVEKKKGTRVMAKYRYINGYSEKRINEINKRLKRRVKVANEQKEVVAGNITVKIGGVDVEHSIFDVAERFKNHFSEVEKHFVERTPELEQIKFAMLTKEHVLLKGKTGTAKSKLGKYSFGYITGAKNFAIQLSKFMSEEYVFGAIDINKMRNEGKVEHITADSIIDSEFAFIDEVFDGNDALLRSLLEVLNERTFTRHTQRLTCKLHSAILTSNYVRDDEVTEAFLDRILYKADVKPIVSNKNRMTMYKTFVKHGDKGHMQLKQSLDKDKAVTYAELLHMANYILSDAIELPDSVLNLYDQIVREYSKQLNCYVSDRKANKMLNILKASALLGGRTKAKFEDIENIKFALVTINNDKEEEVFRAVYTKLISDNLKYEGVAKDLEKLVLVFDVLKKAYSQKLNPKSKEILELNEEAQLFEQKLLQHQFVNGSGFKDVDQKFSEMRQESDRIIREIAKTLKLSGK